MAKDATYTIRLIRVIHASVPRMPHKRNLKFRIPILLWIQTPMIAGALGPLHFSGATLAI